MKTPLLFAVSVVLGLFAVVNSMSAQGLTFTSKTYNVGSGPYVSVGDVYGEGRLDLITGNFNTNTLTVLTNNGNGGFGFNATLVVGNNPSGVLVADVNGSGKPALICSDYGNNTLTVLTNNGSNVFGSNATLKVGSGPQNVVAADIRGVGKLDLFCANYTSGGTVSVYTNNGVGGFGSNAMLTVGSYPASVCAADVNGDGYIDLITASYKGNNANTLTVLTNNGHGVFAFSAIVSVGSEPVSVIAADVKSDGKHALITANNGTNTLTVLTNNGKGVFSLSQTLTVGGSPIDLSTADLNGDGTLDLITANGGTYVGINPGSEKTITILTNNGSGVFGSNVTITVGNGPDSVVPTDVNADGKLDLIAANFNDNTVTVLMNTAIFPSPTSYPVPSVKQQGGNMRVSWPSGSPGWSLQEKHQLATTNWLPSGYEGYPISDGGATSPIIVDGTNKSLIFPSSVGNMFFRLLHP